MDNKGKALSENKVSDESKTNKQELPILTDIRQNFCKEYLGDGQIKSETNLSTNSEDEFHSASEGSDDDSDNAKFCEEASSDPFFKERIQCEEEDENLNNLNEDSEEQNDEKKEKQELESRKELEDSLPTEELEERKSKGQVLKDEGNQMFRTGQYDEAITAYTKALDICPLCFEKDRAILYSNRAACFMKKSLNEEAIKDSTHAIDLHPQYVKAVLRRAELYEKIEKLDEALKDFQRVLELDPSHHQSRANCLKLEEQIKERNEKMKDEMLGKLKELGNMVLRPFGLSTNNFQLQQDPNTGGYSVNFTQNPGNGGS